MQEAFAKIKERLKAELPFCTDLAIEIVDQVAHEQNIGDYEQVREAIEKQKPKKILYAGAAACPTCRKILLYGKFECRGHYCKWCGQRLVDED